MVTFSPLLFYFLIYQSSGLFNPDLFDIYSNSLMSVELKENKAIENMPGNVSQYESKMEFELDSEHSFIFDFQIDEDSPYAMQDRVFLRADNNQYEQILELKDLIADRGAVILYYPITKNENSLLTLSNDKGDKDEFMTIFSDELYQDLIESE